MARIVIVNPGGVRAVVADEALSQWVDRGFSPLGEAAEGAEGTLTVSEWAAELQRRDAAIKTVLTASPTRKTEPKG